MKISSTGFWEDKETKLYHVRCEPLCDWVINYLKKNKNKVLYDFGCGNGQYLQKLSQAGFKKLVGFEGVVPTFKDFDNIQQQDLSVPFTVPVKSNCLFFEVAEHIPKQYENIVIDNIVNACTGKLIMSWAIRGQDGTGHVNCLNNDEVIERFTNKGMKYLDEDTKSLRASIPDNEQYIWFKTTTLVFSSK
jgi:SAM-dependent methyltransferase